MKITHAHTYTSKFFVVPYSSACKITFFFFMRYVIFDFETRFARLRLETHGLFRAIFSRLCQTRKKKNKKPILWPTCASSTRWHKTNKTITLSVRASDERGERVALENQLVVSVVVTKRIHVRRILVSDVRACAIRTRPTILLDEIVKLNRRRVRTRGYGARRVVQSSGRPFYGPPPRETFRQSLLPRSRSLPL